MPSRKLTAIGAVASGGALGAICRSLVEEWLGVQPGEWPWPIFIVNMVGCFMVGVLIGRFTQQRDAGRAQPDWVRPLLITGFLGGFTTFSTYIWEVVTLSGEFGEWALALAYLFGSVIAGVACVVLGLRIGTSSVRAAQTNG